LLARFERRQEESVKKTLAALSLAAGIGFAFCQSAGAVPGSATGVSEAAMAASSVQPAQYHERRGRHGVTKCFRVLVVGPYRCHYYPL
jgi:hypothetical protein